MLIHALAVARAVDAQPIDTARVMAALRDAATACAADTARLWGRSLCGPIAIVDRTTRLVFANDTVAGQRHVRYGDVYLTTLPAGRIIANTAFPWGGRQWTMVVLPLPGDRYVRATLVLHEVYHREQAALGLSTLDALNNHLDFRDGRTWLRLELRALAEAIRATDPAQMRRHAEAALLFRARRRSAFPGSDATETSLEIQEGLAEYTGHRLAMLITGQGTNRVADHVANYAPQGTYVRSFAYGTGPGLGVLLDRVAPDWREAVRTKRDLSTLLADGLHFRIPRALDRTARDRAELYGFADIDSAEAVRERSRAAMLADYRSRLSDGATITFRQARDSLSWGYDPTALIALDLKSVIYPFGTFNAPWGSLNVESNGVLVQNDLSVIRVALSGDAPGPDARRWTGNGWTVTLNPGWKFAADPAKGRSAIVVRSPP